MRNKITKLKLKITLKTTLKRKTTVLNIPIFTLKDIGYEF